MSHVKNAHCTLYKQYSILIKKPKKTIKIITGHQPVINLRILSEKYSTF